MPAYSSVNLGTVELGSSRSATVTLTIPSATTLTNIEVRTQGATGLAFTNAGGGTCQTGTAYAAGAQCTVKVSFAPQASGNRYGAVVLSDAGGLIASVYLRGNGFGPQGILSPGTATVNSFVFQSPEAIAADGSGNVFVGDQGTGPDPDEDWQTEPSVYEFSPPHVIKNLNPGTIGSGFGDPDGLAVDGAGNVYVSDIGFSYVGLETEPWVISPGVYKETLRADGSYVQTSIGTNWVGPAGIAVDGNGNVFVADSGNCQSCALGGTSKAGAVYKMELQADGSYIQKSIGKAWASPQGVAVDASANVYVAEWTSLVKGVRGGPAVFKETPQANGSYVQTAIGSGWKQPSSVVIDASGSLFVLDGKIWRETPEENGRYTRVLIDKTAIEPTAFAMTAAGNLLVTDSWPGPGFGAFFSIDLNKPPVIYFPATPEGLNSAPQTVSLFNIGNASLAFSAVSYPPGFGSSEPAVDACTSGTVLAAGGSCSLPIEFQPGNDLSSGSLRIHGDVAAITDSLNMVGYENRIAVTGLEIPPQTTAPVYSLKAGAYRQPQQVKITDSMAGASIYYTLHGATPSKASTLYSGPITVASTETIKAIAIAPGHSESPIVSARYSIKPPAATPAFSPSGGNDSSAHLPSEVATAVH
ncbi:MAG: chitobiase/beta-hexosaminidase C-terminal domain-containing protein [Terracidiphilus sp.]